MIKIKKFVFSPFQENTYVLSDTTGEGIIIDAGALFQDEKEALKSYIEIEKIKIKALVQTHSHLDHVFGAAFVKRIFNVPMLMHRAEIPILSEVEQQTKVWGIPGYEPVEADEYIDESHKIKFGESELETLFVPGHAPGHLAFVNHAQAFVIGGDCLFFRSIGRTDLPLSNHKTLIDSIRTVFFGLPNNYTVYTGHMQSTTIGDEKTLNPFLK